MAQPAIFGPLNDNPDWEGENVAEYIAATLEIARDHARYILPDEVDGTINLAWQFGTDFNYLAAAQWFQSIDKLIHYVNMNTSTHGVNLMYSTPSGYAAAKIVSVVDAKTTCVCVCGRRGGYMPPLHSCSEISSFPCV